MPKESKPSFLNKIKEGTLQLSEFADIAGMGLGVAMMALGLTVLPEILISGELIFTGSAVTYGVARGYRTKEQQPSTA